MPSYAEPMPKSFAYVLVLSALALSACSGAGGLPQSAAGPSSLRGAPVRAETRPTPGPAYFPNPLTVYNGVLYGTTIEGGAYGGGEVFSVTTSGAEKAVYQFTAATFPDAALHVVSGTIYGTSRQGGPSGDGRVFGVNAASGKLTYEYDFSGTPDGRAPLAGLIDDGHGAMYGTTESGGSNGFGSIYSINAATGKETVLYSFPTANGGAHPGAELRLVNGLLYGTTLQGGSFTDGTVFSYDRSNGTIRIIYSFEGYHDGSVPAGAVTYVNGKLFGATLYGGGGTACGAGCGIVYSIDPATGGETVLHRFVQSDGATPDSGLTLYNGKLYGSTMGGGQGYGTIYSVDPKTGVVSSLYDFKGSDGTRPEDLVIDGGHLYGSAQQGGSNGRGTIFRYDPPAKVTPIYNF